jgi:hypothetical protein
MNRLVTVLVFVALGCATVVTEPNPPGPPPAWSIPYAGRIVLFAPSLPERTEEFETAWWHRLSILGITARIVYDDTRAVFDIYGVTPQEFTTLVSVLTDPGGWRIGASSLGSGFISEWLPGTQGCECSAQLRLHLDPSVACQLGTGGANITRGPGSASYGVNLKVTWTISYRDSAVVTPDVESERRADNLKCPDQQRPNVIVKIPPAIAREEAFAIALAIGGGDLPEIPRVVSVAPAGAGRTP